MFFFVSSAAVVVGVGGGICAMISSLVEVACLPTIGDGGMRVDSPRYKWCVDAISAWSRREAYVTKPEGREFRTVGDS